MSSILQIKKRLRIVVNSTVVETFYYTFTILSYLLLILSVLTGCIFFRKIPKEVMLMFYYMLAVFVLETAAELLAQMGIKNLFLFPLYSAVEFMFIGGFLIRILHLQKAFMVVVGLILVMMLVAGYTGQNTTLIKPVTHLLVISGAGYYLVKTLKEPDNLQDRRLVFIIYTLIFYFSVSLLLFFFMKQLSSIAKNEAYLLWGFHNVFLSLFYSLILFYFLRLSNSK